MNEKEKIESLLKPRYKVIADYPKSDFNKGEVVEFKEMDSQNRPIYTIYDHEGWTQLAPYFFDEYPHLFRKLQWWEKRKPEEMPEYVKFVADYMDFKKGQVYKYSNWNKGIQKGEIGFMVDATSKAKYGNHHAMPASFNQFQPATPEEYTLYINNQK